MSGRKYYCWCDSNCKFETMTKEQILAAIAQAANGGLIFDENAAFISKIKESNAGKNVTFWVGTQAQYNALASIDTDCMYLITDKREIENAMGAFYEDADCPECYYRVAANGELEWQNPPLVTGNEYRTMERWQGAAVYKRVIDMGSINSENASFSVQFDRIGALLDYGIIVSSRYDPSSSGVGPLAPDRTVMAFRNGKVNAHLSNDITDMEHLKRFTFTMSESETQYYGTNAILWVKYTKE